MKWSKLKHAVEQRFAPVLERRLTLHQARYRYTDEEVGRVWIALDGRDIASFSTIGLGQRYMALERELQEATGATGFGIVGKHEEYEAVVQDKAHEILRRAGEHGDVGALADLEASLSMTIDDTLISASPLLRALAMVDRRVGKRRLRVLTIGPREHPLVRELHAVRCAAERLTPEARPV